MLHGVVSVVIILIASIDLLPVSEAAFYRGNVISLRSAGIGRQPSDTLAALLRVASKRKLNKVQCFSARSQCFSSVQCCSGLVCAAPDDFQGDDTENPGTCVREKDVPLCSTSADCPIIGSRCLQLDRTEYNYCVPPPVSTFRSAPRLLVTLPEDGRAPKKISGGLGSSCVTSADCNEVAMDGVSALCCQRVHMHRQGSRHMCDRYRPGVSNCL